MCKDRKVINGIIEDAKQDTEEVYALYERDRGLVGLVKCYSRSLAIFYDVSADGVISYFSKSSSEGMSYTLIRRVFGVDDRYIRRMYRVAAC